MNASVAGGSAGASSADGLTEFADRSVCHLETIGRVTGRRRVVELWFAVDGASVYFLAGGGEHAHWVRNLEAEPAVRVRLGGRTLEGRGRVVESGDEERRARELIAAKYQGWRTGRALSRWAATALPVAVDVKLEP